jgi:anti-anti-sigma regulatory factor/nucleotide-binding universal stress UspA family protein
MIIEVKGDVLKLKSSLVENQWPAIKSAVRLLLNDHPNGVIIDCSGLTQVSEHGAKTFLDASNYIQSHNARVVVSGMPENLLAEIRNLPGLRSQLVLANSIEEARSSLNSVGQSVSTNRRGPVVLVPLIGAWHQILEFAAAHAINRKADIHLLYVMQIPRNLPIGVPAPEIESDAENALRSAEQALKKKNVRTVRLTTRSRDLIEGTTKFAIENKPDMIVVGYQKSELTKDGGRCPVISVLCHEAPCDVAVYCISE